MKKPVLLATISDVYTERSSDLSKSRRKSWLRKTLGFRSDAYRAKSDALAARQVGGSVYRSDNSVGFYCG